MRFWRRRKKSAADPNRLVPPEGIPIELPVAGLGVRLAAQTIDIVATTIAAIALVIAIFALQLVNVFQFQAIAALIFFIIRIPYFVFSELMWNGRTFGKRLMKIKVVAHDGGPLTTHALVLRNLMKEAEVFLPVTLLLTLNAAEGWVGWLTLGWIVMSIAIPVFDPYRRRLGDMMAGTHVVHLPQPILLKDLAVDQPGAVWKRRNFAFSPHQLDHYGAFELQTLETVLRADGTAQSQTALDTHKRTLSSIVDRIRTKIGYADAIPEGEHMAFLKAFYAAQRAHLEQRQLFGDRRADKHHASDDNPTQ